MFKVLKATVGAVAVVTSLALAAPPAAAAQAVTSVSGTVNCTGSWTTYTVRRPLTGYSKTQLYVTNAASSPRGGTGMGIGVQIFATGTNIDTAVVSANRYATMDTSDYLPRTEFKMRARMTPSSGTCDNAWAGTLYY